MDSCRAADFLTHVVAGSRVSNCNTNDHRDSHEPRCIADANRNTTPNVNRDAESDVDTNTAPQCVSNTQPIPSRVQPDAYAYPNSKRNPHPDTDRDAPGNSFTNSHEYRSAHSHQYRSAHSQLHANRLGDAVGFCDVRASGDRDTQRDANYHEPSIGYRHGHSHANRFAQTEHGNTDEFGYASPHIQQDRDSDANADADGDGERSADSHIYRKPHCWNADSNPPGQRYSHRHHVAHRDECPPIPNGDQDAHENRFGDA